MTTTSATIITTTPIPISRVVFFLPLLSLNLLAIIGLLYFTLYIYTINPSYYGFTVLTRKLRVFGLSGCDGEHISYTINNAFKTDPLYCFP